jgi:leucyl aminopeptidase
VILLNVPERHTTADVVAVGLIDSELQLAGVSDTALPPAAAEAAVAYLRAEQLDSAVGSLHLLPLPGATPSQVWLTGLGQASPADLRRAGVVLGRRVHELAEGRSVNIAIGAPSPEQSRSLAEGLVLGGYDFRAASGDDVLHTVDIVAKIDPVGLTAGDQAGDAAGWARDLGNLPAAELTPARLGELAEQQLTPAGCTVHVRDEQWLAEQGFGGLLAVGGGSSSPPRLIEAAYRPRGSRARSASAADSVKHVVLVGKGITFDTGGLNLKPADAMRMMHTDMCGGAAVLAALHYIAMQKLPIRVTALVPAAENSVSGTAMRPSDVVRQYGGRTTEIGNTDAEGRLVLADALAYAVARLRPDVVIDIATLTGAMKVALGMDTAGYFANDDELAHQLDGAAEASGEAIWRMPLEHGYASLLDSSVADSRNDPGNPGGITAALFLQPFVGSVRWAHLDIAGPARAQADGPIFSRGATGYGVRLLSRYVELAAR